MITASALKAATSPTKPTATPHKLKDQSDAKEIIISNAKVQTSTSNLPTKDAVDSYTAGLHNKAYTEMLNTKYAASQAVESAESPTSNAPQEASAQGEMTTNISLVSELSSTNPSEVIPSSEDVASASEKHAGETSDGTVYMPDVMVTSKVMATPEVSSAHENGHLQEFFDVSKVVAVTNVSTFVNIVQSQDSSQLQSTQFHDFLAPTWSSNVKADKPSSGQEIITQAVGSFPNRTVDSILDISSADAVTVASGEVPTFREVGHEEAIQVSSIIPEVSSPQSNEHLPVVESTPASLSTAVDAMSEMSGDAQRSISLTDQILVQTEVLEEEDQTKAAKELTGGTCHASCIQYVHKSYKNRNILLLFMHPPYFLLFISQLFVGNYSQDIANVILS